MSVSFWTMFCVVYGGVLFLSLKRGAFALVLGFLSGLGVAFFCLRYLPGVFTSQVFYAVAAGVLCGVALGTVAEKRRLPGAVFFWLGALLWGSSGGLVSMDVLTALLAAITGGTCLYLVCGAVLPREVGEKQSCCVPPAGFWVSGWEYGWIFCIFNPDFTGNPGE